MPLAKTVHRVSSIKLRLFVVFVLPALSCLSLSGCAAVFGRKMQEVFFDSEPKGAKVYVSGYFVGRTPVTARLKIVAEYSIVYVYGENVREFTIHPINYTQHASNRILCAMDLFPGALFFGGPPLLDIFTGSCRGFQHGYFKSMINSYVVDEID